MITCVSKLVQTHSNSLFTTWRYKAKNVLQQHNAHVRERVWETKVRTYCYKQLWNQL